MSYEKRCQLIGLILALAIGYVVGMICIRGESFYARLIGG